MARQRLGQHFLSDTEWREQIAEAIQLYPRSAREPGALAPDLQDWCWLEVGAGHGEMTQNLLRSGRQVFAIELDKRLLEGLQRRAAKNPNLTIVPGDVLKTDLRAVT